MRNVNVVENSCTLVVVMVMRRASVCSELLFYFFFIALQLPAVRGSRERKCGRRYVTRLEADACAREQTQTATSAQRCTS
jgi:hypothetical protein